MMMLAPGFPSPPQGLSGPMLRLLHPIPILSSVPSQPNSPAHAQSPGPAHDFPFVPSGPATPVASPPGSAASRAHRPIPAPVDTARRLSNPPSLPLTPKSPHLS
eukprot:EG_transcript_62781